MTKLFEQPVDYLNPFSDAQINQGLWFITVAPLSDHIPAFWNTGVSNYSRAICIHSMYGLFQRLFSVRCSPHLMHLTRSEQDDKSYNPLNLICYVWWDNWSSLYGTLAQANSMPVVNATLDIMEKILVLPSHACQESALHGLGHACDTVYERPRAVILGFIERNPRISPELRAYAENASRGSIL
jgi:hypothetical protein